MNALKICKGTPIIYHYKEWRRVYYLTNGNYDWVPAFKYAEIIENPRDEYGRFSSSGDDENTVKIKTQSGDVITTTLEKIELNRDPSSLSEEEARTLWNEISHGSIYYRDYRNSVGVFERTALDYYEGYCETLENEEEENFNGFFEHIQSVEYLY